MDTIHRTEAASYISKGMGLPEKLTRKILQSYVEYVRRKIDSKESIGVLRICYIHIDGYSNLLETFSYVCTEISRKLEVPPTVVKGVLFYYEDMIIRDLKKYYPHNIFGLLTIKMVEGADGIPKPRIYHSTLSDEKYRVQMSRTFYRKVCG